eukprot:8435728-Karenia_brevis.AAC.1
MAAILKTIFDPSGHHLQFSGIQLDVPRIGKVRLFATFESMVADESALHGVWMCKGSGGVKCCIECAEIVDKNWTHVDCIAPGDRYTPYNKVCKLADCKQQTSSRISVIMSELAALHAAGDRKGLQLKQTIH